MFRDAAVPWHPSPAASKCGHPAATRQAQRQRSLAARDRGSRRDGAHTPNHRPSRGGRKKKEKKSGVAPARCACQSANARTGGRHYCHWVLEHQQRCCMLETNDRGAAPLCPKASIVLSDGGMAWRSGGVVHVAWGGWGGSGGVLVGGCWWVGVGEGGRRTVAISHGALSFSSGDCSAVQSLSPATM